MKTDDELRLETVRIAFEIASIASALHGWWTVAELHRAYLERVGIQRHLRSIRRYVHVLRDMGLIKVEHTGYKSQFRCRFLGWPKPLRDDTITRKG